MVYVKGMGVEAVEKLAKKGCEKSSSPRPLDVNWLASMS
jgi:hypothetical protein